MAEHTPGPWIVTPEDPDIDDDGWIISGGPYEAEIAAACPQPGGQSEELANARLIAAAPDLLEAVRMILPLARGYAPAHQTAEARRTCDGWLAAAEAAITKAVGFREGAGNG